MKGVALVVETDGVIHRCDFDGEVPSMKFHNEAVGGHLEKVPGWDYLHDDPGQRCVVYCNEDGKGMQLPVNMKATGMWLTALRAGGFTGPLNDYLVGRVLILYGDRAFMKAL